MATVEGAGPEAVESSFVAELKFDDGEWRLASVEETDPDPLAALAWLVGEWSDERPEGALRSSFAWSETGVYLIRNYTIEEADQPKRQGTQYTAWDAGRGVLRSWVFGGEGIVAEGTWTPREDHWAIDWRATLRDGRPATARQMLKQVDEDTFQTWWTAIDVDGELRPDSEPVTVRRAPAPTK